jgi:replicative DNA helicase
MNVVPLPIADAPAIDIELEQALLGALLVANEPATNLPAFLEPQHFHEPLHQRIYEVITDLAAAGKTANALTVRLFLPPDVTVGSLTLPQYLARLAAEARCIITLNDYARTIFNHWRQRELVDAASNACRLGHDPDDGLHAAFERIDELRAAGFEHEGTMRGAGAVVTDFMTHVAAVYQGTAVDDAVHCGPPDLDERLGGFKRGELLVMAGRPGMGKTTVAGTIALSAARRGHGVAFFSLEMAAQPIMARMQADELFDRQNGRPLTVNRLLRADIGPEDFDRMTDAARAIEALPLVIDDAPQAAVGTIYAKVRSLKNRFARSAKKLDLVIIDYLKFLRATDRYIGQRHYEVGEITAGLKAMAKELGVAVLLLAQLNRKVEDRTDRRPQLADLRESGDIEADADVVMLLFREAYYLQNDPEILTDGAKAARLEEVANTLEIIIAKQRMGPVCTVQSYINLECSAVRDLDTRHSRVCQTGGES